MVVGDDIKCRRVDMRVFTFPSKLASILFTSNPMAASRVTPDIDTVLHRVDIYL